MSKSRMPFKIGISDHGRGVFAIHGLPLAPQFREARQEAGLFVHADIGLDFVRFRLGIEDGMQRMQRQIGVPDSVVHIEITGIAVYGMVVAAEVAAVFADIHHARITAVQRRIKGTALGASVPPAT